MNLVTPASVAIPVWLWLFLAVHSSGYLLLGKYLVAVHRCSSRFGRLAKASMRSLFSLFQTGKTVHKKLDSDSYEYEN